VSRAIAERALTRVQQRDPPRLGVSGMHRDLAGESLLRRETFAKEFLMTSPL
jgi:hypothetical protein